MKGLQADFQLSALTSGPTCLTLYWRGPKTMFAILATLNLSMVIIMTKETEGKGKRTDTSSHFVEPPRACGRYPYSFTVLGGWHARTRESVNDVTTTSSSSSAAVAAVSRREVWRRCSSRRRQRRRQRCSWCSDVSTSDVLEAAAAQRRKTASSPLTFLQQAQRLPTCTICTVHHAFPQAF